MRIATHTNIAYVMALVLNIKLDFIENIFIIPRKKNVGKQTSCYNKYVRIVQFLFDFVRYGYVYNGIIEILMDLCIFQRGIFTPRFCLNHIRIHVSCVGYENINTNVLASTDDKEKSISFCRIVAEQSICLIRARHWHRMFCVCRVYVIISLSSAHCCQSQLKNEFRQQLFADVAITSIIFYIDETLSGTTLNSIYNCAMPPRLSFSYRKQNTRCVRHPLLRAMSYF